jgi:hypothetical protein
MKITYLVLGALVALPGCGDDTGRVDDFITALSQASCDWEFRCCSDPEITQLDGRKFGPTDPAACMPYRRLALENELYVDKLAVREGRMRIDAERAQACLDQNSAKLCNPKPGQLPPPVDPLAMDQCVDVFVGNTAVGNECIYAGECVKGAHCVIDGGAVGRGVCVPYQHEAEICNADADCDPKVVSLYCAKADFHCRLRSQVGEACEYTRDLSGQNPTLPMLIECDTRNGHAYCDPVLRSCAPLPTDGQPCLATPLPPGVIDRCDPDPTLHLTCVTGVGSAGICRAPVGLGQDCSQVSCAKGLYCDTQSASVCAMLPGFGQRCDVAGYQCAAGYSCQYDGLNYTCDQPASVGEDCTSRQCDIGLYCPSTGTRACRAQLPDGTPCTAAEQCLSDYCTTGAGGTLVCTALTNGLTCTGR